MNQYIITTIDARGNRSEVEAYAADFKSLLSNLLPWTSIDRMLNEENGASVRIRLVGKV